MWNTTFLNSVFIMLSVEFSDTQTFSSLNVGTWKLTIQVWDWRCVGGKRSPDVSKDRGAFIYTIQPLNMHASLPF